MQGEDGQGDPGDFGTDVIENTQKYQGLARGYESVEGGAGDQRGDGVHVVHHAGDDLAGAPRFVEAQRQPLQMFVLDLVEHLILQ